MGTEVFKFVGVNYSLGMIMTKPLNESLPVRSTLPGTFYRAYIFDPLALPNSLLLRLHSRAD